MSRDERLRYQLLSLAELVVRPDSVSEVSLWRSGSRGTSGCLYVGMRDRSVPDNSHYCCIIVGVKSINVFSNGYVIKFFLRL